MKIHEKLVTKLLKLQLNYTNRIKVPKDPDSQRFVERCKFSPHHPRRQMKQKWKQPSGICRRQMEKKSKKIPPSTLHNRQVEADQAIEKHFRRTTQFSAHWKVLENITKNKSGHRTRRYSLPNKLQK